jgi:membrane protein required for colicin V production
MIFDLVVLLLIIYGFYLGYRRGIIQTVFDTLSIFIGLLAALKLSPIVIGFLQKIISVSPAVIFIIGFILTFFLVLLLIRFIGKKLEDLFKVTKLNFINKIAGGVTMGFVFALCLSLLVVFLDELKILDQETKDKSISYELLEPLPQKASKVFGSVKPYFTDFWEKTVETMDKVKEKAKD